jgi:regulation of enolase protein 1 (concanavalin A-like superfamily)
MLSMCQNHFEAAISQFQKYLDELQASMQYPFWIADAYVLLGNTYLKKIDYYQAIQHFQMAGNHPRALPGMEEAYIALGTPEKFVEYCHSFKEQHPDVTLKQWYLEPAKHSDQFPHPAFKDLDTLAIDQSWVWMDEFDDCSYRIIDSGGLEISASNGRSLFGLNLSAPRLMREISGNFAATVTIKPASEDKPQMGGLLIWRDRDNFLRFEKGVDGEHEIRLQGYVDGKYQIVGRGMSYEDNDETYLRLERSGDQFTSYCSIDGENWFTCGKMTLPLENPIQVGIHAIGIIDRTIYCGEYKEGTATLFRNFRIWKE